MIAEALRRLELGQVPVATPTGRLVGASGLLLESTGCPLRTGQRCQIELGDGQWIDAQAVGFKNDISYLMPFKHTDGLATGARVLPVPDRGLLRIGSSWLGRIVNGLGEPIDGLGRLGGEHTLDPRPPEARRTLWQRFAHALAVADAALAATLASTLTRCWHLEPVV